MFQQGFELTPTISFQKDCTGFSKFAIAKNCENKTRAISVGKFIMVKKIPYLQCKIIFAFFSQLRKIAKAMVKVNSQLRKCCENLRTPIYKGRTGENFIFAIAKHCENAAKARFTRGEFHFRNCETCENAVKARFTRGERV